MTIVGNGPGLKLARLFLASFHGLKAPLDSPACADSLRAGSGFLCRAASRHLMRAFA
jgi:hypothetical protein